MASAPNAELDVLAEHCWQLVGLADDLAAPDAWLRLSLFGRDVFVQNFDGELRGFANVCSHRGFPLRVERSGIGPVRCGFHGWTYRGDGVPAHVPRNAELFQLSRDRRQELALAPISVEKLGRFVFASRAANPLPLRSYFGDLANLLAAVSDGLGAVVYREREPVASSWRHYVEVTLDDYHLPAVHPTTFGTFPLAANQVVYRRHGVHSSYTKRRDPDWSFDGFWADVAAGGVGYDRTGYKMFSCFPNTELVTTRDVAVAATVVAETDGRTTIESFVFEWRDEPHAADARAEIAAYFARVFREDREACARWATTTTAAPPTGALGALEQRIGWFREALADVLARGR